MWQLRQDVVQVDIAVSTISDKRLAVCRTHDWRDTIIRLLEIVSCASNLNFSKSVQNDYLLVQIKVDVVVRCLLSPVQPGFCTSLLPVLRGCWKQMVDRFHRLNFLCRWLLKTRFIYSQFWFKIVCVILRTVVGCSYAVKETFLKWDRHIHVFYQ